MLDHLLLAVENHFQLEKRGLAILPDMPVPANWKQSSYETTAKIEKPDGSFLEFQLIVNWAHFNIRDPKATIDQRWRLTFTFPDASKTEVPLGSKVYVSAADHAKIKGV